MTQDTKIEAAFPERLWLSAADADNEHQVWFEPDEGGVAYVRADIQSVESDLLEVVRDLVSDCKGVVNPGLYEAAVDALSKAEGRAS